MMISKKFSRVASRLIKLPYIKYYFFYKGKILANRIIRSENNLKLDLGCGSLKREGNYVGLDVSAHADICWDLRWGLPFKDGCVSEIRSDHFFEHLDIFDLVDILRECRRVLLNGGVLDFTVPHLDPYIDAYLKKDYQFLESIITDIPEEFSDYYNTCFDRICWLLHRNGEHKSMFDKESIIQKLYAVGFSKVNTRNYNPVKDTNKRYSSIYVEAFK